MRLGLDRIPSPIGTISLVTSEAAIVSLDFNDYDQRLHRLLRTRHGKVELHEERERLGVREALDDYFAGNLDAFASLPLATSGTPFQQSVWQALLAIAPGTTFSYGELARRIGKPSAMRAVGLANGANPIAIIVPCHRVIGANGTLTGYGGGLPRKRWLLAHEGAELPLF